MASKVGNARETFALRVVGGDANGASMDPALMRFTGERNRGGCVDGGGVMLADIGGGELYVDFAMLSAEWVRSGGGVEGLAIPSVLNCAGASAMMR